MKTSPKTFLAFVLAISTGIAAASWGGCEPYTGNGTYNSFGDEGVSARSEGRTTFSTTLEGRGKDRGDFHGAGESNNVYDHGYDNTYSSPYGNYGSPYYYDWVDLIHQK